MLRVQNRESHYASSKPPSINSDVPQVWQRHGVNLRRYHYLWRSDSVPRHYHLRLLEPQIIKLTSRKSLHDVSDIKLKGIGAGTDYIDLKSRITRHWMAILSDATGHEDISWKLNTSCDTWIKIEKQAAASSSTAAFRTIYLRNRASVIEPGSTASKTRYLWPMISFLPPAHQDRADSFMLKSFWPHHYKIYELKLHQLRMKYHKTSGHL